MGIFGETKNPQKKKAKLDRTLTDHDKRLMWLEFTTSVVRKKNERLTNSIIYQWFMIYSIAFLYDVIANYFHWRHQESWGAEQIIIMVICIMMMIRYYIIK